MKFILNKNISLENNFISFICIFVLLYLLNNNFYFEKLILILNIIFVLIYINNFIIKNHIKKQLESEIKIIKQNIKIINTDNYYTNEKQINEHINMLLMLIIRNGGKCNYYKEYSKLNSIRTGLILKKIYIYD